MAQTRRDPAPDDHRTPAMTRHRTKVAAFVVPTLGRHCDRDEDVLRLLLFAGAQLRHAGDGAPGEGPRVTFISLDGDISGWPRVSALLAADVMAEMTAQPLEAPRVPGLATGCHKAAYDLLEAAKTQDLAEVHCLDRGGAAYYITLVRRLGMSLLDTPIGVHVVGGAVFRAEADDRLLDRVESLADDALELGSVERADALFVHDHRAWSWYTGKATAAPDAGVHHLHGASRPDALPRPDGGPSRKRTVAFYGTLAAEGGLPLFIDVIERLSRSDTEILFVGPPGSIGGMDAVSYIRLRTAGWGVPIEIARDLPLTGELDLLAERADVVVCDTRRRDSLRAKLVLASDLPVLHVSGGTASPRVGGIASDNPGEIAQRLRADLTALTGGLPRTRPRVGELWAAACSPVPSLGELPAMPPLQPPAEEPKVSVCLTHFNRPEKLRAALRSLEGQSYGNFDVIVVDDGSPDSDVQRELDDIGAQVSLRGWQLVRQQNRYLGAARNEAARHATGEYLVFMDDDNLAKPSELRTLMAVACRTGADIVTTFYDGFVGDGLPEGDAAAVVRFPPFGVADPALGVFTNCFGDANALYRRTAFEGLGGFTEDYGITHEDWELFCRASVEGLSLVCVPEALFWYRMDPDGMFRGRRKQLHELANCRRHIRPHLDRLPYAQAKLVQLAQGLATDEVAREAAAASPRFTREGDPSLPFARVAVVIRTRDRPLLLRRALRSVLDQTFGDWIAVVVNDGGAPGPVSVVVDEVAHETGARVRVLHNAVSLGMQGAANAGVAECSSELVVLHDDDDTWDPSFLTHVVSHFDEHGWDSGLGGVVSLSEVVVEELDDDGEMATRDRFVFNPDLEAVSLMDLSVENRFPPISFVFRRAAYDAVGPFDERWGPLGDWEFHLRILNRFDIQVVPLVLARYHHRGQGVDGAYGNSVHAQTAVHRAMRVALVNHAARSLGEPGGAPLAQLLAMGELRHQLETAQRAGIDRLGSYLWALEQKVDLIAGEIGALDRPGRNLAENGDFRVWPGLGPVHSAAGGYDYLVICPGFLLSYDGRGVSYLVERLEVSESTEHVPAGKTYLHIENDGSTQSGSWFTLECILPSALRLSGRTICVSAIGRMDEPTSLVVTGRHQLRGGRDRDWPASPVSLGRELRRWSVTLACPPAGRSEVTADAKSRVILKLPHDRPFSLDLTDLQIELGGVPTAFDYRAPAHLAHRRFAKGLDTIRRLAR